MERVFGENKCFLPSQLKHLLLFVRELLEVVVTKTSILFLQSGRSCALSAEGRRFDALSGQVRSKKDQNWQLLPILVNVQCVTDRDAQCQFKVTGWGIVFICGMVFQCFGTTLNPGLSLDQYSRHDTHCR